MADLLSGKNMIYQKFKTTFTETFAGGTGSILGGIFFGIPGISRDMHSSWNSTVDIFSTDPIKSRIKKSTRQQFRQKK
jgi:hypothetical protein